jgi:hypothetical protein
MNLLRTVLSLFALSLVLGCGTWSVAAAEEPRTINDCEKIQAADAYNQCLAKFGPTSKLHNLEPEKPGDIKSSGAEAAATAGKAKHGGRHGRARHTSGRKRVHFTIRHHR